MEQWIPLKYWTWTVCSWTYCRLSHSVQKKSHIDFRIAFKLQVLAIKLTAWISSITFLLQFQLSIKYHGWSIKPWNVNSDHYFAAMGFRGLFLLEFPWFVGVFLNFWSTAYAGYSGSCSSNAIIFNVSWEREIVINSRKYSEFWKQRVDKTPSFTGLAEIAL